MTNPPRKPQIPLTRPWLEQQEADAAAQAVMSGWVSQGPEVAAFEKEFAAGVGAPFACAVSNCTTALHLALLAVGVQPGDEVITVSHSFIATANVIRYCGAVPVFVDIQPHSPNLDPGLVAAAVSPRTRAILCVHQMGMPCDLAAILEVARRHSLPVVEDAACALGSEILWQGKWEKIGKPHGDIACFSFHPRKIVTTGEGGMLTCHDPELDGKFRLWRQHGMSVPDTVRHESLTVIFESYVELGYNYRLTDIQAAVGRRQLERLPEIVSRRRLLAARYRRQLAEIPGLLAPEEPDWARTNWQSFWVELPPEYPQIQVMQALLDAGVASRRGIMCSHLEPAYEKEPWACGRGAGCRGEQPHCRHLQESEAALDHSIILPLYPQMTLEEQDYVVAALKYACSLSQQEYQGTRWAHGAG